MKIRFLSFRYFGFFVVIIFSFWSVLSLFHAGFFPMHDDTQVARVFEMAQSLKDGMFPVRWVSDLGYGYGYPIFNFYAPLAYYLGGFLVVLGVNALFATKMMFVVGILGAGVSMYLFARELWGELGGIISGLFYVYIPYHAVDIYVRGDVAEFWAYAFIPLVFLGLYKIICMRYRPEVIKRQKASHLSFQSSSFLSLRCWLWVGVGAFGYAGIILSHNLTALMVTPFLLGVCLWFVVWMIWRGNIRDKILLFVFLIPLFGVLLSAFYWVPVFSEMKYTNVLSQVGGGADFRDHFVCLNQLWNSPWGFGGSVKGCLNDGLSFRIGKIHLLFVGIAFLSSFFFYKKQRIYFSVIWISLIGFFLSIFFMLSSSQFIWEVIRPMAFFQYPWRFLVMTAFFSSLLAGVYVFFIQSIYKSGKFLWLLLYGSFGLIIFFTIVSYAKLFVPQLYTNFPLDSYTNTQVIRFDTSKVSDEYMPKGFVKPNGVKNLPHSLLTSSSGLPFGRVIVNKTQQKQLVVVLMHPESVLLRIAPFPAWQIFVDGMKIFPKVTERGYLFFVDGGTHTISAMFVQTPIEFIGDLLSLSGIVGLLVGIMLCRHSE